MDECREVQVKGFDLTCPLCRHGRFCHRRTLLDTRGASFFGFAWADKYVDN